METESVIVTLGAAQASLSKNLWPISEYHGVKFH